MRRFTRLTNGFSTKVENHAYAVALQMMYYNFVRIYKSLRVTPAMAAGVTDRLWEMADIVKVVEDQEAATASKVRGPVQKARSIKFNRRPYCRRRPRSRGQLATLRISAESRRSGFAVF